MDAWLIAAVAAEVSAACRGGRVQRVGQPARHDVVLELHTGQGRRVLLLSAEPAFCRVHFLPARPPNPPAPPPFCQVLRRHLEGARLLGCHGAGMDRVLELHLEGRDELGNPRALRLVAELTGRLANLVLVDAGGRIVDCLRRDGPDVNRVRQVLPGRAYVPPPRPAGRVDPVVLLQAEGPAGARAALERALAHAARERAPSRTDPAPAAVDWLRATVFGLPPALCRAVAAWAAGAAAPPPPPHVASSAAADPEAAGASAPPAAGETAPTAPAAGSSAAGAPPVPPDDADPAAALAGVVVAVASAVLRGPYRPCLVRSPDGPPSASAWPLPGCPCTEMPSASEAVRRAAEAGLARGREEALRARLGAALRAAAERTRRRLDRQEEEWREVEAADGLREAGELLLAFGHLVPRGAATARLPSFEDPARTVPVALDPSLTPAANAQRLLRRYRKAHRAQAELAARLEAGRAEQARLEALSQAVARARGLAELEAIEAELAARGLFPTRPTGDRAAERRRAGAPPAASGPAPAPLEFAAPGGWRILVGRSAAGNDHLTGRLARPGDIWLHARQMPGSHVLLRPPAEGGAEGTPVEQAILAAARCAAYFSAGRHAASVPVDWTERRHVWKPAGAPPGFFRYTRERTVFVAPGLPQGAPERA